MNPTGKGHFKVILAALAGAMLAVLVAVLINPKPWLLESSAGQRMLQAFLDWRAPVVAGAPRMREGDTVRNPPLTTIAGQPAALHTYLGPHLTVVNLWATWCGPCLKELPVLEAFAADRPNAQVLAVAMDDPAAVSAFLAKRPVKLAQLLAAPTFSPGQLGNPAGVLPYSVLLDAEGRVIARRTGMFHAPDDIRRWVRSASR